jgi:hypothetical protein
MNTNADIYIVTEGEYSDYHICAVFRTREEAEVFLIAGGGDHIEEYVFDKWSPQQGKCVFEFDLSGNLVKETLEADLTKPEFEKYDTQIRCDHNPLTGQFDMPTIRITIYSRDRERAIKIASERYTRIRAVFDEAMQRCGVQRLVYLESDLDVLSTVANILAGFEVPYIPPRCEHDRLVNKAMGITYE